MAKIDWAFTEDGDLGLSDPKTDSQGLVLYVHMDGTINTEKGEDGKELRDIGVVEDLEAEKQTAMNRLRTDSPDWYHHPGMGGNLTDLIGEPQTRLTGERGAALITRALTYEGLYHSSQISVRPIPMDTERILFMIDIAKNRSEVIRLPLIFSLEHGLMDFYQVPK